MNLGFGQLFILICLAGLLFADLPKVVKRLKATILTIQKEAKSSNESKKTKSLKK